MIYTRAIIVAAAIAAFAPLAQAQDLNISTVCAGRSCVTAIVSGGPGTGLGKIIKVPEPLDEDFPLRDRLWVQYCAPQIFHDVYGVPRYTYAHPGCEHGRSE